MVLNETFKNKRVLVIGDSFTDILGTHYTWLNRLRIHYNWNIDNKSIAGSGSHYAFHTFMNYTEDFDICIFAWSEPTRLFHKCIPNLNSNEAVNKTHMIPWQKDIYKAAQHYYMHLIHDEMEVYKNTALLFWLDHYLKNNYPNKLFIHFHCFPKHNWTENVYEKIKEIDDSSFYHTFETGLNISPTLLKLSSSDPDQPNNYAVDQRSGHLSKQVHEKLFYSLVNYFKKNEYENGKIVDIGF